MRRATPTAPTLRTQSTVRTAPLGLGLGLRLGLGLGLELGIGVGLGFPLILTLTLRHSPYGHTGILAVPVRVTLNGNRSDTYGFLPWFILPADLPRTFHASPWGGNPSPSPNPNPSPRPNPNPNPNASPNPNPNNNPTLTPTPLPLTQRPGRRRHQRERRGRGAARPGHAALPLRAHRRARAG